MYELHAQADTAAEHIMIWHAVRPGGVRVSLCGLGLDSPSATEQSMRQGTGIDQYCSACMEAVRDAMGGCLLRPGRATS